MITNAWFSMNDYRQGCERVIECVRFLEITG